MDYMLLIYRCERRAPDSAGFRAKLAAVNAFTDECRARGVYRGSNPLEDTATATTVRVRDGAAITIDGPFAETREQLAGYYLLDCRDLDEALELAARCPLAAEGSIEVRPVRRIPGLAGDPAAELRRVLAE
ncbi:MAG: YciI family protein [Actinomycetota bacterium]|nr:YciI family protein [Actinomycetota bacterium]